MAIYLLSRTRRTALIDIKSNGIATNIYSVCNFVAISFNAICILFANLICVFRYVLLFFSLHAKWCEYNARQMRMIDALLILSCDVRQMNAELNDVESCESPEEY